MTVSSGIRTAGRGVEPFGEGARSVPLAASRRFALGLSLVLGLRMSSPFVATSDRLSWATAVWRERLSPGGGGADVSAMLAGLRHPTGSSPWRQAWFWQAQLLGWTLYFVGAYVNDATRDPASFAGTTNWALRLIGCLLALAISSGLALVFDRLPELRVRPAVVIVAAVFGAAVAGSAWHPLFQRVTWLLRADLAPCCPHVCGLRCRLVGMWIMLIWSVLYLAARELRLAYARERDAIHADRLASEARFQMLLYQINPHFLFNALNSVRALVTLDAVRAREMITHLSAFLRETLVARPQRTVCLREELATVEAYLAIEQVRHAEALQVQMAIAPEVRDLCVPVLLLHPLVENAITHGFDRPDTVLQLAIRARRAGERLIIEVANSGSLGSARADGTGIGLQNIRERLAYVYGGAASLDLLERDGEVVAQLTLPVGKAPEGA